MKMFFIFLARVSPSFTTSPLARRYFPLSRNRGFSPDPLFLLSFFVFLFSFLFFFPFYLGTISSRPTASRTRSPRHSTRVCNIKKRWRRWKSSASILENAKKRWSGGPTEGAVFHLISAANSASTTDSKHKEREEGETTVAFFFFFSFCSIYPLCPSYWISSIVPWPVVIDEDHPPNRILAGASDRFFFLFFFKTFSTENSLSQSVELSIPRFPSLSLENFQTSITVFDQLWSKIFSIQIWQLCSNTYYVLIFWKLHHSCATVDKSYLSFFSRNRWIAI